MPTLGRVEKRNRGRVEPKLPTAIRVVSAVAATTTLTLTFDQPVVLKGTPAYTTDVVGAEALSATSPSINTVVITFSASIAAASAVNIPGGDPAIRNKVGGFVADTTFPC